MPPVSRLHDIALGHGSFIPTPVIEGSPNVFTNNLPTHRRTDDIEPHSSPSPSPPHGRKARSGSSTVFVNNLDCMRIGDPVICDYSGGGGTILIQGSGNVICGG